MVVVKKQQDSRKPRRRASKGILSKIQAIGNIETTAKLNVYGRSGTGKTTFACTFPKPLLLIGAEDGTKSVANVKGVDFVRLENSDDLEVLTKHAAKGHYKTVVLDSATFLQNIILKELLGLPKTPVQLSWGLATRAQYGQIAVIMKEHLRALLELDCQTVIIAQERVFNVDNEESPSSLSLPYVASALSPSVVGWLNPACDYIVQTYIRQKSKLVKTKVGDAVVQSVKLLAGVDYCLRTGPNSTYATKFRLPKGTKLPECVVNPSYSKIAKLMKGGSL